MAAAAAGEWDWDWERRCNFRDCVCRWLNQRIPHIAPGKDYRPIGISPAEAKDLRPDWSLLLGVTDGASSLRLSRVRVARSGLILGRSDDKLEVFHDIVLAKPPGCGFDAGAALAADGRSLCVVHTQYDEEPQPLQLSLSQFEDTYSKLLPGIQGTTSHCMPVSYGGRIWTLSATMEYFGRFSVVARRLQTQPAGWGRWEQVGDPFTCELLPTRCPPWTGGFLQGYAVLPATYLILVSLQQYGLFLTFDPHTGRWNPVRTDATRSKYYLPIHGRGVYVEQHDAIYMISTNSIYAYKLKFDDQQQLSLDPPIKIHSVCPFMRHKGYGFLTRLADRLLCSVWISLASHNPCPCDHLHAIVTTFNLRDPSPGGVEVLHSTYRRVDMVPDPTQEQMFCFLQEFEDEVSVLQHEEVEEDSLQHADEPAKKLACCRAFEMCRSTMSRCFECGGDGHVASQCSQKRMKTISTIPPFGPSRSIPVDPSSWQQQVPSITVNLATTAIKKDLFIICQAGSRSVIFKTGPMDGDGKPLQPCYVADDGDRYWMFFQGGSKLYAFSGMRDGMLEFGLKKDEAFFKRHVRRPTRHPFIMVTRVGGVTIAVTDDLTVFHQEKFSYGSTSWLRYNTYKRPTRCRNFKMSGYVVVNDDTFIVCDAVTCSWHLFVLGCKHWRFVMHRAAFEDLPSTIHNCRPGLLIGRCVSVDGFIYTCTNGGLSAYELVDEGPCLYVSKPIFLPFSWHPDCVGEDMCLDYAGKDEESGTIWFYVVGGRQSLLPMHYVPITTLKIQTERTAGDKMIPVGIDCVGLVRRFIHHDEDEPVHTRCCFAVSCA